MKQFPRILIFFLILLGQKPSALLFAEEEVFLETYKVSQQLNAPWTVHHHEATVYSAPGTESEVLMQLEEGEEILGKLVRYTLSDEDWLEVNLGQKSGYVSSTVLTRVHPDNRVEGNLPIGSEKVNRWWGLPLDYAPNDLMYLPDEYTGGKARELRIEAAQAAEKMLAAAADDGINILVVSAYRSGSTQKSIYDENVRRDGRSQRYSAPPGHSEHQLGTTLDFSDPARRHTFSREFDKTPQGAWLAAHAHRFGFRQTYTRENEKETGYIAEPWHWRYMGDPTEEDSESRGSEGTSEKFFNWDRTSEN